MSRIHLPLAALVLGASSLASADAPKVVADIAPVHSLVAKVMQGVSEPGLIIPPEASPHEYSLRPSEAALIQDAEILFWVGEDLTPWLERSLESLADDANIIELLEAAETQRLAFREGALFEAHDHSEHGEHKGHEGHKEHEHEDHHGHKHDEHHHDKHEGHGHEGQDHESKSHEDHGHASHEDHDDHGHAKEVHAHGKYDPHVWLSVTNASNWLNLIASQLSAADPKNASTYFANAATAQQQLTELNTEVAKLLEPVAEGQFLVFHDAYQYFENEYGISAAGAISVSDASDPSPARIAEIQERVRDQGIDCVLSEPQFNPNLVQTVLGNSEASTGVIDPLGISLEPGADLYDQLIRGMATSLVDCLK